MRMLDCGEGDEVVIDGKIVITVAEITDDEVCLKIELPEGARVAAREDADTVG